MSNIIPYEPGAIAPQTIDAVLQVIPENERMAIQPVVAQALARNDQPGLENFIRLAEQEGYCKLQVMVGSINHITVNNHIENHHHAVSRELPRIGWRSPQPQQISQQQIGLALMAAAILLMSLRLFIQDEVGRTISPYLRSNTNVERPNYP